MNPERSWSFDKVTGICGTIYVDFHIKEKGREKNQSYYYYTFIDKFFFDRRKNRMDRFLRAYFVFARKFVEERKEEGKAFRGKRNFIVERSIFERKWGEEKSFLDRVEATASMQQTSILNRITHTR